MADPQDVPDYDADEDHEAIDEPDWDGWEAELEAAKEVFGS